MARSGPTGAAEPLRRVGIAAEWGCNPPATLGALSWLQALDISGVTRVQSKAATLALAIGRLTQLLRLSCAACAGAEHDKPCLWSSTVAGLSRVQKLDLSGSPNRDATQTVDARELALQLHRLPELRELNLHNNGVSGVHAPLLGRAAAALPHLTRLKIWS